LPTKKWPKIKLGLNESTIKRWRYEPTFCPNDRSAMHIVTRNSERRILKTSEIPADFNGADWQFGIFPHHIEAISKEGQVLVFLHELRVSISSSIFLSNSLKARS